MTVTAQFMDMVEPAGECVSANDYAGEALQRLRHRKQPWAFVLDLDRVVGVLFEKDLEIFSQEKLRHDDVREYMHCELVQIGTDIDFKQAERLLKLNQQKVLAVMERNKPIGIVTSSSLSQALSRTA
jgi:predicted transcriptional regulator